MDTSSNEKTPTYPWIGGDIYPSNSLPAPFRVLHSLINFCFPSDFLILFTSLTPFTNPAKKCDTFSEFRVPTPTHDKSGLPHSKGGQ